MEVGLEGADRFELERWVDEDVGLAVAGGDFPVAGEVFEDAGHCRTNGGDLFGGLHFAGGFFAEDVAL